jgi:hypothetical protein
LCSSIKSANLKIENIVTIVRILFVVYINMKPAQNLYLYIISPLFAKLKKYEFPVSDQIPVDLIQAWSEILLSEIHKLIYSVWNKEELPDQWKESIVVPVHKKGDKIGCNNYHAISLLSTSYKSLLNILLSRLSPYIN